MTVISNWRRQTHLTLNILVALALALSAGALFVRPATTLSVARTFYVSRNGNNADGLSWATAWNELSRINWGAVAPGDTILVDGGAVACPALGPGYNCGMVYNSTLSVNKSGTSGAPITIRLAPGCATPASPSTTPAMWSSTEGVGVASKSATTKGTV
jgi:hypothetical protein